MWQKYQSIADKTGFCFAENGRAVVSGGACLIHLTLNLFVCVCAERGGGTGERCCPFPGCSGGNSHSLWQCKHLRHVLSASSARWFSSMEQSPDPHCCLWARTKQCMIDIIINKCLRALIWTNAWVPWYTLSWSNAWVPWYTLSWTNAHYHEQMSECPDTRYHEQMPERPDTHYHEQMPQCPVNRN